MATTLVINGIEYQGCQHTDGNEYYCKTVSGNMITSSSDLRDNWSSAIRCLSISINNTYTGELKWYGSSDGSGQVDIPSEYLNKPSYLAYYQRGAKYPFGLSSSDKNNAELDLGWVSADLFSFFSKKVYTLTIDPNGGSMYNGENITTNSFTTKFQYNVKTYIGNLTSGGTFYPNTPSREGYNFLGFSFSNGSGGLNSNGDNFYFNGEGPGSGYNNGTQYYIFNGDYAGDVTATAQWGTLSYTIKYNANGGTGTISNQIVNVGDIVTIKTNTFIKTGYTFIGWTTNSNGTDDGHGWTGWSGAWQDWEGQHGISSYTLTLYARWQANKLTITYNGNGATSGTYDGIALSPIEKTFSYSYGSTAYNVPDYNNSDSLNFQRLGYRGKPTKEWITSDKKITIDHSKQYTAQQYAEALGLSLANGNAEKTLYVNWEPWEVVRIYTNDGWKLAVPYVYTTEGWKQTAPYVYTSNGWKGCN